MVILSGVPLRLYGRVSCDTVAVGPAGGLLPAGRCPGTAQGRPDHDGPRQQVADSHAPLIADCGQALHAYCQRAEHPAGVGYQKKQVGGRKRNVSDDGLAVGHGGSRVFRRGHAESDELFPDAPAIEQTVADKDVSRCG